MQAQIKSVIKYIFAISKIQINLTSNQSTNYKKYKVTQCGIKLQINVNKNKKKKKLSTGHYEKSKN